MLMVCPFLIPKDMMLAGVSGVYNAVEFIGEPLGDVMFYGRGAGAGATASAVVGDLMLIMQSGAKAAAPVFEKTESVSDFDGFVCRRYVSVDKTSASAAREAFGVIDEIEGTDEYAFITKPMSEKEYRETSAALSVISHVRMI